MAPNTRGELLSPLSLVSLCTSRVRWSVQPTKAEKEPMRHLYDRYNGIKHQIRDVEGLLVSHRQQQVRYGDVSGARSQQCLGWKLLDEDVELRLLGTLEDCCVWLTDILLLLPLP